MKTTTLIGAAIFGLAIVFFSAQGWATEYMVTTFLDDPSVGTNDRDGKVSLREAVMAASTNQPYGDAPAGETIYDIIRFKDLTIGPRNIALGDELVARGRIRIEGGPYQRMTLSGGGFTRIFSVEPGAQLNLKMLDLTNGSVVKGAGGAIRAIEGQVSLTNVQIEECRAIDGGAISGQDGSTIYLYNSSIIGNRAARNGGGIYATTGTIVNLTSSTIGANEADEIGGGIAINHQSIQDFMLQLYCYNVTIADNQVGTDIWNQGEGGGVGEVGSWPESWATTGIYFFNTVAANNMNSGFQLSNPADDLTVRLDRDSSNNLIGAVEYNFDVGVVDRQNGNMIGSAGRPIKPELDSLQFNWGQTLCYRPRSNSLLVNNGSNSNLYPAMVDDQRGFDRIRNGTVDIGAVER